MMCLADFSVNYDTCYSTDINKAEHDDVNSDHNPDEQSHEHETSQTQKIQLKS